MHILGLARMRQETDMLRVRSEFWRMWKRISGWGLECTDSMLSDHFNQTMSPAKTNCTLKCILFYFHWIHLNFNLKGDSEIVKCVHLDARWGHLRSCTHTELCKNSLKNDTAAVLLRDILLSSRTEHPSNLNYHCCIYAASLWGFLIQKLELSGCFLFSKFTCHKDLSVGWSEYWS